MSKSLVILSGGQDSTTCLFWARKQFGPEIHALTFFYGQRHAIEIDAAQRIARLANVLSHETLILPKGILMSGSPLVDHEKEVGQYGSVADLPGGTEPTFVAGRNILFLTLAANRAFALGCERIIIGISSEDFGGYPDCRPAFREAMERALQEGLEYELEVLAPLQELSKAETVRLAADLGPECLDALAYSHTCYNGQYPPCGRCHACLLRAKGFKEAGIPDPLVTRAREQA